ncbi:MAG: DedA family protein [Phycisphaeraceae bacterium]|nr:DedA family protein [Phycisphaeraceae bacterium]MBX3407447.1 DedA family protein [Phycisphaeraceae bacterium]
MPEPVDTAPPEPMQPAILPRWHVHRRLYDWVLSLAHHKHATAALFIISFAESSFFPVPPDVLQIALTLERRSRAWWYATVSTVASVLGGIFGWIIGFALWAVVSDAFFRYVPGVTPENFALVERKFQENAFLTVFTAAFTPIPYKVFTIAAGVFHVSLWMLVIGSIVGRGGRFFAVAALIYIFGPPVKRFIERYFNLLTLMFVALVVIGVVVWKIVGS